jgi:hypothetical protein
VDGWSVVQLIVAEVLVSPVAPTPDTTGAPPEVLQVNTVIE